MTRKIIQAEGFIVLLAMIYLYYLHEFNYWIFLLLLFVPDLSILAYLLNQRTGAIIYNLFHTYIISIPVIIIGHFLQQDLLIMSGIIWIAHIGMDRLFGYGLKYKTSFKATHIQQL